MNWRGSLRILFALSAVAASAGRLRAAPPPTELWVLANGPREVLVVDTGIGQVVTRIPIHGGAAAPELSALAFSTYDSANSRFAFVSQGSSIHVLSVASRTVTRTIDLALETGLGLSIVGLASAPTREFSTGTGTTAATYLFVAANASITGQQTLEPYWLVIEQTALTGDDPTAGLIVGSGALSPPTIPATLRGLVAGVSVPHESRGTQYLRASYAIAVGSPPTQRAVTLYKQQSLSSAWKTVTDFEQTLGPTAVPPVQFEIVSLHDREFPLMPTGTDGRVINTATGDYCAIGGALTLAHVRGPAPGAYQVDLLDSATDELVRVNAESCAIQRIALGLDPQSIAASEQTRPGEVYVSNRGSDSITVVGLDGSTTQIPLAPPNEDTECAVCPGRLAAIALNPLACSVRSMMTTSHVLPAPYLRLSWTPVACTSAQRYAVFCQCTSSACLECHCNPATDLGCYASLPPATESAESGGAGVAGLLLRRPPQPWKQLGLTLGTTYEHHYSSSAGSWDYVVVPVP